MLCVKGIDAIFKKDEGGNYNDNARMYQDIIIFGSTIPENKEFKLQDLASYLLYNNAELEDQYKRSKLNESNIIENIVQGVKRNVDDLVGLRVMIQAGEVKQEQGTELVPIFKYTLFGYILSLIIQSLRTDINVEDKLYDLFQRLLKVRPDYIQSYIIFTSNWLKKMHEKGYFGRYISILKKLISSISNIEEFVSILQRTVNITFFHERANAVIYIQTWKETINELEAEVRKLYLYDLKLSIDVIVGQKALTLEYEKLRFTLRDDVEVVALEGYCSECKQCPVLPMKIVQYYSHLVHAFTPLKGLVMQCSKCNSPHKTLQLPNVWLKGHPLYKRLRRKQK
jgi:hypothetical protein